MQGKKGVLAVLLLFIVGIMSVSAAVTQNSGFCIRAEISNMNPTSVEADEDFTFGVHIENCGEDVPKSISLHVKEVPTGVLVKNPKVITVPKLTYANSERFLTYNLRTTKDVQPGVHILKMQIKYGDEELTSTEDFQVPITVIRDEADPRVSSVSTSPTHIYEGESVELTLVVHNFGSGVAKSLDVALDHSFQGSKKVTLGAMSTGENSTAKIKFKAGKAGDYSIPVQLAFEDDFGKQVGKSDIQLTVLPGKTNLNLASVKSTPILPYTGDEVEYTMRIENFGEKTYNSVRVLLDHPFKGTKEAFIGTLEGDEDGPAVFTFMADKAGEFSFPVTVTYRDDFGEEKLASTVNMTVLQKEEGSGSAVMTTILLLIIGGLIFYIYRVKKSKDEVIQQLLKGNKPKSKKG